MNQLFLSVVIPIYNEEKKIRKNLQIIKEYLDQQSFSYEIIAVNDGSTDNTKKEIEKSEVKVILLNNDKNRGKGFSVKKAMLTAKGENVIFFDADLATPITELPKLLNPLKNNDTEIVIGSRAIGKKDVERSWWRAFFGLGFRLLKSLILGIKIFDSQCGFKGFKKEVIKPIFEKQTVDGWSFDVEILLIASNLNYRILEVPISWTEQDETKTKLWRDIPAMFCELIKIRFKHL